MTGGRAVVHIGLAKTGTKAIQEWCAGHRDDLAARGVCFPHAGTTNDGSGHHCLAWQVSAHKKAASCKSPAIPALAAELAAAAPECILVSSEEFSLLSYSYLNIRKLLGLFAGREVAILAYLREQAEYFNSFYVELLQHGLDTGSADDMAAKWAAEARYDYNDWFRIWDDLLPGGVIARPYDRALLAGGDALTDFRETLGLGRGDAANKEIHKTPNNRQVAAIAHVVRRTRTLPPGASAPGRVRRLIERVVALPSLSAGERFWGLDPALVTSIRERFASPNREFFQRHGVEDFTFSSTRSVPKKTAIGYEALDLTVRREIDSLLEEEMPRLAT